MVDGPLPATASDLYDEASGFLERFKSARFDPTRPPTTKRGYKAFCGRSEEVCKAFFRWDAAMRIIDPGNALINPLPPGLAPDPGCVLVGLPLTANQIRNHALCVQSWAHGRMVRELVRVAANAETAEVGKDRLATSGAKRKNINARMLETIQMNPDAMGWSSEKWRVHLKCAKSSVVATPTWKDLLIRRDRERAERSRDRRHRRLK
jgi:hypothetical protein